jgi:hypothetical protein
LRALAAELKSRCAAMALSTVRAETTDQCH